MQADIDLARNGRLAFRAVFFTILAGILVFVMTGRGFLSCTIGAPVLLLLGYKLWHSNRADRFQVSVLGAPLQSLPPEEVT